MLPKMITLGDLKNIVVGNLKNVVARNEKMIKLKKKNYPILDFLKVKYHIKKKEKEKEKIKIIHSTVHTLKTNYYLKYL